MRKFLISFIFIVMIVMSCGIVVAMDGDDNCSVANECVLEEGIVEPIPIENDLNSEIDANSVLSSQDNEKDIVSSADENIKHVYVSPDGLGNGTIDNATSIDNALNSVESNTVIHMANGNYNINSPISISSKENITILADNPKMVKIATTKTISTKSVNNLFFQNLIVENCTTTFIKFEDSNNLKILNCDFSNVKISSSSAYFIYHYNSGGLNISDCCFENNVLPATIYFYTTKTTAWASSTNRFEVIIKNCTFVNDTCSFTNIGIQTNEKVDVIECKFINNSDSSTKNACEIFVSCKDYNKFGETFTVYNCYFGNRTNPAIRSSQTTSEGLYFKDNVVESKYAIYIDLAKTNKIASPTNIQVLNNETMNVTVGDKIRIPIQLLDDNGNYIHAYYSKSNTKTDTILINVTTYKFDYYYFVDDHYYVDYTVPNTLGKLPITATCSYFDMELCTVNGAILNVKPAVDFVWNDIASVDYGENVTINVNISNLESGNLTYLIYKGSELVRNISDSFTGNVSTIEVDGLGAGDYTVKVNYADGEIYGPTTSSKTFTVNKANSTIDLNMDSIIAAGDKISVEAIVPGVGGTVTFRINNTAYSKTESVSEGVAVAVFDALGAGEYTIIASWDGDDNYNPSEEFNTTFKTVNKDYPVIEITHEDINIGEDVLITVTVPGASGDVIVTIDGVNQTLTLNNSAVNTTISSIRDGRHVVVAEYLGDDNYKPGSETISFTVDKLVSSIDLAIGEAKILEDVPITITIVNATGDVVVTIDGVDETHTLHNGVATTKIPNVSSGNHVVSVNYAGDIKYGSSYATKSFTVDKLTTKLELTNSSVEIDKDVILSIALDESINDNVTVIVNGASESVKLTNGCTDYVIKKVSAGKYNIVVNFDGNDKFDKSSNATSFDVSKLNSNLQASMEKPVISVGDDVVIIISIDSNASGLINVEGKYYEIGDSIVIKGLANGTHTFTVKYGGDEKFNADESDVTVTVNKLAFKPEIEADDVSFGEEAYIWVYGLPEDATGNVTIYVDNLPGIEGTYAGVDDLAKGSHNVRVTYSGDDKYNASEASKSFKVYYTIEIENEDTDFAYGEDAVINVTLPEDAEGILGVLLDGKQTGISAKVSNGSAVFTLSNLTMGDHTLSLTYQGSPEAIETNVSISVVPAASVPENVTTTDSITLNLPENATGNLTVIVDGNETVIPVVNGSASYSLGNLPAGDHEVTATYNGNYGQWTLMNDEKLSVAKSKPTATINAPASVTAGTVSTLSVSLPSDAKGVVLFDVDGNKYYADVNNGVASVSVSGLSAGDKAVSYRYLGDDKYSAFDGKATLKVTAPQTPAKTVEKPTLTLKKVKVKKSAKKLVIRATLKINGKLASGKKVTFKFNGKTYKATTNKKGVAKITVKKAVLKKLKVGKKVKYQASYGGKTVKKTVKVKK